MIDWVVSPVDQVLPVASEEVRVTDPPSQKVREPEAEMVGAAGAEVFTVMVISAEVAVHMPLETVTL